MIAVVFYLVESLRELEESCFLDFITVVFSPFKNRFPFIAWAATECYVKCTYKTRRRQLFLTHVLRINTLHRTYTNRAGKVIVLCTFDIALSNLLPMSSVHLLDLSVFLYCTYECKRLCEFSPK